MLLAFVALFLVTFVGVAVGVAYVDRTRFAAARAARARLLPHVPRAGGGDVPGLMRGATRLSGFALLEKLLLDTKVGRRTARAATLALKRAGLVHRAAGELVLATVLLAATGWLAGSLFGSLPVALVGAAVGAVLPWQLLARMATRRRATYDAQLPPALETIANSLRAGYSLPAALEFASAETPAPLGDELARLRDEQRLGLDARETLASFAERVATTDVRMFVTALLIQRETGGNLADLLGNLAALMRERQVFKKKVAALTAEPRISALVLAALPFVVFLAMMALDYSYVQPMLTQPAGRATLVGAVVFTLVGYVVMRHVGDVEL